jgi:acyl dehydratase
MPLPADAVGHTTAAVVHEVDARWAMAYSAGLGDSNPRFMDTTQPTSLVAHPVFPVCLEWPAVVSCRTLPGAQALTSAEAARGVHASHDLHLRRLIRPGERLATTATLIGVEAKSVGACQMTRLDTRDPSGELVCRTYQLGILRGVDTLGEAHAEEAPPPPDLSKLAASKLRIEIPVPAGAAHVYTECARIWNPVHTDRAVARAAGLPDIILHGTATLALAVSGLVNQCLKGDPSRVRRLGGRFAAMVFMPSVLALVVTGRGDDRLSFDVLTDDGSPAIRRGFLCWEP